MRKFLLLAAATAAALLAGLFVPASSANADGETVFIAGPAQYNVGFLHPTGTIFIGGGTISARCAATSFKGNPVFLTPKCETRAVTCPMTASSCSIDWNARESALRGPVSWNGGVTFTNGPTPAGTIVHAYDCPQPNSCSVLVHGDGVTPGTVMQSAIWNDSTANYPTVFTQITITVHP
jgi:hypothetical protein